MVEGVKLDENEIWKLADKNKGGFKQLSLIPLINDVYIKGIVYGRRRGSARHSKGCLRDSIRRKKVCDTHDRIVRHVADQRVKMIYGSSLENVDAPYTVHLKDASGFLSTDQNKDVGVCPGINTPTHYVASRWSMTEMHHEDAMASSLNGIVAGPGKGRKLWLAVHPHDNHDLDKAILRDCREEIEKLQRKREMTKSDNEIKKIDARLEALGEFEANCHNPFGHKKLVFLTSYLEANEIRYTLTIQNVGDLMVLGRGVYHQVINLDENVSVAVNFADFG